MASRIVPLARPALTSQQIADLALSADRERRRAEKRGDADSAAEHDAEVTALTATLSR